MSKGKSVMTGDEIVKTEEFNIERFMALGFGRYEAIRAVEDAIDWRAVEALLKMSCTHTIALEISRWYRGVAVTIR